MNRVVHVRVAGNASRCFSVYNGSRKGCEMSSGLFNICKDGVVRKVCEKMQGKDD